MTVTASFALPIYHNYITGTRFANLQAELLGAVNRIIKTDAFSKNKSWNSNTHSLTDPTFRKNAIEDYSLTLFQKELEFHVNEFMSTINTPNERYRSFKIYGCWITKTMPGEHAHNHTHGHNDLSGVYYIKTNNKDGNLFFNNPLTLLSHSYSFEHIPQQLQYVPEEGKIVLFPGWLEHGVKTNDSSEERISISFNINFERTMN
jgi:uncharacterized protein (TIGR02466 family)